MKKGWKPFSHKNNLIQDSKEIKKMDNLLETPTKQR
jgi:hypothetical protein